MSKVRAEVPTPDKPKLSKRQGLYWVAVPDEVRRILSGRANQVIGEIVCCFRQNDEPTDARLAERLSCSVATVQRAIREMEDKGVISRQRTHGHRLLTLEYSLAGNQPAKRVQPLLKSDETSPQECAMGADSPPIREFEKEETLTLAAPGGGEEAATAPVDAPSEPTATVSPESSSDDEEPDPTPEELAEWERDKGLRSIAGTIARSKLNIWRNKLEERANPKPPVRVVAPAPQPPPPPSVPADTEGFIKRLETDHSEEWARATAQRLAGKLDDEGSEGFYFKLCREVQAKTFPLKAALKAYRDVARSGTAASKGACFVGIVQPLRKGVARA